jgi:hypothetical protein
MASKTNTQTTRKPAAKKAEPKVITAKAAAQIKPAATLKAEQAARVGTDAGDAAPGYVVRWPKPGYDLLLKTDAAPGDGSKWLVRCNQHGQTLAVSGTAEGDRKGRQADRDGWCSGCK